MPVALVGAAGQLGRQISADFRLTKADLDLADRHAIPKVLDSLRPSGVILAAAYTDVDGCETNADHAFAINSEAPEYIAEWCALNGAWLMYMSTNCVFDGRKTEPYREEDAPRPISVYGASKLAGENAVRERLDRHFVIRSSWLFGPGGNNFVKKILALAEQQSEMVGVSDEVASPTYAIDLGRALGKICASGIYGIYHLTNAGKCSRLEYMRAILDLAGLGNPVRPVALSDFHRPSRPPAQSALANIRAAGLGIELRPWEEALAEYMRDCRRQS